MRRRVNSVGEGDAIYSLCRCAIALFGLWDDIPFKRMYRLNIDRSA